MGIVKKYKRLHLGLIYIDVGTFSFYDSVMEWLEKLKDKAARLKQELSALAYAFQDPASGFLPKLLIGLTIAYAFSPIDLIPDFIPVLGYLDDLLILPLLTFLAVKALPPDILDTAREKAAKEDFPHKTNWAAGIVILILWGLTLALLLYIAYPLIKGLLKSLQG